MDTELIDTQEAARILMVADCRVALRIARREGLHTERGKRQDVFLRKSEVEALARRRGRRIGPGRPPKSIAK